MKTIFFLLLFCSVSEAKEYHFTVLFEKDKFEYKTTANTWEEAFEREASVCFDFFINREPFTDERAMAIIDACANPQ